MLSRKRASMRAHSSQASGAGAERRGTGADGQRLNADAGQTGDRTLTAFLRIPRPLYDLVFGREWFRDPKHPAGAPVSTDVFAGLP